MFRTLTLAALSAAALSLPAGADAAPKGCPPGLAKKSPACVPPGQAKKQIRQEDRVRDDRRDVRRERDHREIYRYRTGERIGPDYVVIRDYDRYGLSAGNYVRTGDYVYRIDPETREVLNVIGAVASLLD